MELFIITENLGINYNMILCILASSVDMFKNIIDKYIVKAGYTQTKDRLHLE